MTVYTAHEPVAAATRDVDAADKIVFVKEGFSWPAFFFAPFWLVWHRMWLVLLGYIVLAVLLGLVPKSLGAPDGWTDIAMFVFALLFALEANQLRRWTLARSGYREVGVAAGHDRDACERKFFAEWLHTPPFRPRPVPAGPAAAPAAPMQQQSDVIGSFPQPGGR